MAERELSRQVATDYRQSILEHVIAQDRATRPEPVMIDMQPEIEWRMWPALIDFMIDVHARLRLQPQTLFLAVNIVNRYCSRRIVFRKHFQLMGSTALWIAAKYEDKKSRVPTIQMLRHLCCKAYAGDMFVQMEGHMLNTLEWNISHCAVDTFLTLLLSNGSSSLLESLGRYIAEITLYRKEFVGEDPYMVARCIHALSLHLLNVLPDPYSELTSAHEVTCLTMLVDLVTNPPHTLSEKFSTMEHHQVTRVVDQYVMRQKRAQEEEQLAAQNQMFSSPLTPPSSVMSSRQASFDYACTSASSSAVTLPSPQSQASPPGTPFNLNPPKVSFLHAGH